MTFPLPVSSEEEENPGASWFFALTGCSRPAELQIPGTVVPAPILIQRLFRVPKFSSLGSYNFTEKILYFCEFMGFVSDIQRSELNDSTTAHLKESWNEFDNNVLAEWRKEWLMPGKNVIIAAWRNSAWPETDMKPCVYACGGNLRLQCQKLSACLNPSLQRATFFKGGSEVYVQWIPSIGCW